MPRTTPSVSVILLYVLAVTVFSLCKWIASRRMKLSAVMYEYEAKKTQRTSKSSGYQHQYAMSLTKIKNPNALPIVK